MMIVWLVFMSFSLSESLHSLSVLAGVPSLTDSLGLETTDLHSPGGLTEQD